MKKLVFLMFFFAIIPLFSQENGARGTLTDSDKNDTIKGTKRALIIGISDYSSSDLTLKYADDDATLFKNYLTKIERVESESGHKIALQVTQAFQSLLALVKPSSVNLGM